MENSIEVPYKTNNRTIPLLGIYPEKSIIQKDTCTPMFTATIFTIARTWKQPKCPSTEEWIKKMQYIYTMEYYSAIKRNKTVIQSEVSQKEKNKYRILTHIWNLKNKKQKKIMKNQGAIRE